MSESTQAPQAPQGEFRCPQCGGQKHAATDQGDFVCVCGHYFDPPQAEDDVLAARQGAQPTLTPEFVAAAEIEANTPIATVTGSTAMALEIESLKQQLAAVTAERDRLAAEGVMLRQVFGEVVDRQGIDHEDENCPEDDTCTCELVAKVNAAFKNSPATAAESERMRRLERFVEAVLKFDEEGQHIVHLMLHPLCQAWRNNKALASLYATKGGA